MNKEGYHCPTEEAAVGHEAMREGLRKKYNIKEGDIIQMSVPILKGGDCDKRINKTVKVRIMEIHKYFVTVIIIR